MATPQLTELMAWSTLADHARRVDEVNRRGWEIDVIGGSTGRLASVRAVVGNGLIRLGVRVAGDQTPAPLPARATPAFPS